MGDSSRRRLLELEAANLTAVFERADVVGAEVAIRAGLILSDTLRWTMTRPARSDLVAAVERLVTDDTPIELRVQVAWAVYRVARNDGSHERCKGVLQSAGDAAEAAGMNRLACLTWCRLSEFLYYKGWQSEGRPVIERAALLSEALADPEIDGFVVRGRGLARGWEGDHAEAIRLHRKALSLWGRFGNEVEEATEMHYLSIELALNGDAEESRTMMNATASRFAALENRFGECMTRANLGIMMARMGEYEESNDALQAVGHVASRYGLRLTLSLTSVWRAQLAVCTGDMDGALEQAERAYAEAISTGLEHIIAQSQFARTVTFWSNGRLAEGVSAARLGVESASEGELKAFRPAGLVHLCCMLAFQGARAEAEAVRDEFLGELDTDNPMAAVMVEILAAAMTVSSPEAVGDVATLETLGAAMEEVVGRSEPVDLGLRALAALIAREAPHRLAGGSAAP